jgi:hypothetical protein
MLYALTLLKTPSVSLSLNLAFQYYILTNLLCCHFHSFQSLLVICLFPAISASKDEGDKVSTQAHDSLFEDTVVKPKSRAKKMDDDNSFAASLDALLEDTAMKPKPKAKKVDEDKAFSTSFDSLLEITSAKPKSKPVKAASDSPQSAEAVSAAENFDDRTIANEARVSDATKKMLTDKGIVQFTEIQKSAFDPVYTGRDILARSRTGTVSDVGFVFGNNTYLGT